MFINFFLSVVCSLILEINVAKFLILDFFADFINNNQDINMNKLGALNWKIAGQSAMHEVSNFVQKRGNHDFRTPVKVAMFGTELTQLTHYCIRLVIALSYLKAYSGIRNS